MPGDSGAIITAVALFRPSKVSSTDLNLPVIVQRSFLILLLFSLPYFPSSLPPCVSSCMCRHLTVLTELSSTCSFERPGCLSRRSRRTAGIQGCSLSHVISRVCAAGPLLLLPLEPSLKVSLLPDALHADWSIASPSINLIERTASPLTVLMGPVHSGSQCCILQHCCKHCNCIM